MQHSATMKDDKQSSPTASRTARRRSFRVRPSADEPIDVAVVTADGVLRGQVVDLSVDGIEAIVIGEAPPCPKGRCSVKVLLRLPRAAQELKLRGSLVRADASQWHQSLCVQLDAGEDPESLEGRRELHAYVLHRQCEQLQHAQASELFRRRT